VIIVDVGIAQRVDKVAIAESAGLGYHHGEEGIRCNIEWHAQEDVGRALIELAAEATVGHIELEENMAWREVHLREFAHIPRRNKEPAGVGVVLYLVDEVGDLVDVRAVGAAPRAPLVTVDGSQLTIFTSPLVPDAYFVVVEILNVSIASEEPKQFVYDRTEMEFLGGEEREAVIEMETHLIAKSTQRTGARPVVFGDTVL
jgi:hypothetical protein